MSSSQQLMLGNTVGAAPPPPTDPYFKYVTLLLHGDGTNGAQNNTFLDSSGNNFTITTNGSTTTQGTFSPYGDNWSNYFGGDGNYLSVPYTAFTSVAGDFTIEAWINVSDAGRTQDANKIGAIVSGYASTSVTNSWAVNVTISGSVITTVTFLTNDTTRVTATGQSISINQWHHVAVVRSGTTVTIYVDGSSIASATYSSTFTTNTAGTIQIARSGYGSPYQNWLKGYISNLRLVNGTAVYTGSTYTVPTAPLTAITNTKLLTCQSNRFIDNSTNNYTVTLTGLPYIYRFSPFSPTSPYSASVIGGSAYFDGVIANNSYLTTSSGGGAQIGTGTFTLETWVYSGDVGIARTYLDSATNGFGLSRNASNQVVVSQVGVSTIITGTIALARFTWAHIAVTRNSSNLVTLYVNGVSAGSATSTANFSNTSFTIGRLAASASTYMYGYMSDIRLIKGSVVYTSAFTPPTAPLSATSASLLLSMTNAGIYDNAEMGTPQTVGTAQVSTSVVKFGTGSMAFLSGGGRLRFQSPYLAPTFGTGDFTIEGWVYVTSLSAVNGLLGKGTPGTTGWAVTITTAGKLQFTYTTTTLTGTTTLSTNTWYYFAVVRSGSATGNVKIYLNGSVDATSSGAVTDNFNQTDDLLVGSEKGGTNNMSGYLDDIRITSGYARTITSSPTAAFPDY